MTEPISLSLGTPQFLILKRQGLPEGGASQSFTATESKSMKREPELTGLAANHQQDSLESAPWQPWALMNLQAVATLARVLCDPRRTGPSSSHPPLSPLLHSLEAPLASWSLESGGFPDLMLTEPVLSQPTFHRLCR